MIDNDTVAVTAPPFRNEYGTGIGSMNVCSLRNRKVCPGMQFAYSDTLELPLLEA